MWFFFVVLKTEIYFKKSDKCKSERVNEERASLLFTGWEANGTENVNKVEINTKKLSLPDQDQEQPKLV